jgi:hypothetical protein
VRYCRDQMSSAERGGRGTYGAERLDLIHEWVEARGDPVEIVPFAGIPVELLDTVRRALVALEAERVLVPRPPAGLWIEKESRLVGL